MVRSPSVRAERPGDIDAIRCVHDAAFGGPDEGRIVEGVRGTDRWIPELSLVALDLDGRIVGHALTSVADLVVGDGGIRHVLVLGPVAVLPEHQGAGVGAALVEAGLVGARAGDWPLIAVLGHATYYPRFGFEPARPLGIEPPQDWPTDHWMLLRLPAWTADARGVIRYPPAFGID